MKKKENKILWKLVCNSWQKSVEIRVIRGKKIRVILLKTHIKYFCEFAHHTWDPKPLYYHL